jgi:N-acetylmuramoyl-L-alanine amidase
LLRTFLFGYFRLKQITAVFNPLFHFTVNYPASCDSIYSSLCIEIDSRERRDDTLNVFFLSKRTLFLACTPLLLLALLSHSSNLLDSTLSGKVIIIDAGHGGVDSGANRPGILEKNVNLAVAILVKNNLERHDAKVILSRAEDVDLSDDCDNEAIRGRWRRDLAARVELVDEHQADLFVSIHANVSRSSKRQGAEVFFSAKSKESKLLAGYLQTTLNSLKNTNNQAAVADYFVLRRNKIPAALIELGYMTNPQEKDLLLDPQYQYKLSDAIATGILDYYAGNNSP